MAECVTKEPKEFFVSANFGELFVTLDIYALHKFVTWFLLCVLQLVEFDGRMMIVVL
jgi:hypothetical protein